MKAEPWRFDFFNALRQLERAHPDRPRIGDSAARREEYVDLGQDPYLEFPASNLARVDRTRTGRLRILVKFLGLLGPQGALPLATTDESLGWLLMRDDAFPRFLDLFNGRFLQLFFRAWADCAPDRAARPPRREIALSPMSAPSSASGSDRLCATSIPYPIWPSSPLRLVAPQAKSASRLTRFLQGLFGVKVEIDEFVGSWLVFDQSDRTRLGGSTRPRHESAARRQRVQRRGQVQGSDLRRRILRSTSGSCRPGQRNLSRAACGRGFLLHRRRTRLGGRARDPAGEVAPVKLGRAAGWAGPPWSRRTGPRRRIPLRRPLSLEER